MQAYIGLSCRAQMPVICGLDLPLHLSQRMRESRSTYTTQSPILSPQASSGLQIAPGNDCRSSLQMRCLVLIDRAMMAHSLKLLAALLLARFVQQLVLASQASQKEQGILLCNSLILCCSLSWLRCPVCYGQCLSRQT